MDQRKRSETAIETRGIRLKIVDTLPILLMGVAMAVWLEWPVLLHPNTRLVGGIADAYQYTWYLGWFWHALSHGLNPLFSTELNYPHGFGFMYNTSVVAESVLFGWLVPLTSPPFVYNLVFFLNTVLVVALGERLLRTLGAKRSSSMWAGAMMGFMPYLTAQEHGHMSQYLVSPILAILVLITRVLRRQTRRIGLHGMGIGLLLAVEFYTSLELLVTFMLAVVIFVGLIFIAKKGRAWLWRDLLQLPWTFWVMAVGIPVLLSLPGLWAFWVTGGAGLAKVQLHPHSGIFFAADLASPLVPEPWLWLHSAKSSEIFFHHMYGTPEEKGNYLGLAILIFSILVYRSWKHFLGRALFWFSVAMFILSLGNRLHLLGSPLPVLLPWNWISRLPFLDSALPMRLAFFVDLGLIVWITIAFEKYLHSSASTHIRKSLVVILGCVASLASWLPSTPYPYKSVFQIPQPVLSSVRGEPVAEITPDFGYDMQTLASEGYRLQLENMYGFATASTMPLFLGSGYLTMYDKYTEKGLEAQILATERTLKKGHIILMPFNPAGGPMPFALKKAIADTLGRPAIDVQGVQVWNVSYPSSRR